MEAVECGAAALSIVLGYHGKFVPLEELRVACGVSRDGTDAGNIVKAAARYGLKGKGYSREPVDLPGLPLPQIVFWGFNHFLVVEGFGKGRVYLNDPAGGPVVVPDAEFAENFTGVVLAFERTPEFRPGGSPPGLLRPLRQRLAGSEAGLLYVLLASLLLVVPGLAAPVFAQAFVDYCLVPGSADWVVPLLVGMGITAGLRAGLTWLQRRSLLRLETKLALTSSYRFFRHVLRLPVEFFAQRYGGEVGARVAINDRVAGLLSSELAAQLLNALMAAFYVVLMLCYAPGLALVGVFFAGLNVLALRTVARLRRDENMRLLQERSKLTGVSMAGLQAIETLKASGAESDFFARWSGLLAKVLVAEQKLGVYTLSLRVVPPLLASLATVAVLGVGALRVMNGSMTLGMLVAFQSFMISFLEPVGELVGLGSSLQEVEGEVNRLDDVLRARVAPAFAEDRPAPTPAGEKEPAALVSLSPGFPAALAQAGASPDAPGLAGVKLSGRLELREVTFGYSLLAPPLIAGFSLRVQPGARVALVGLSASGKSTVAKLITGLYEPWSGQVLLDGVPRGEVPRAVLCGSLAMVDQDFFLFAGTVREVLTLWDETVPEEDMIQAAKDACIHDEIAARPGAYQSRVEEGGTNFSGGQRQRLEIARALVVNPSLLVLDEATSALDPVTEKQIDDNLRRRGCTCVLVAHRLSTVRDCDEIVVLEHGRVVQRGTHDAMVSAPGPYRRLINA
jgi:NHLM bacteriocin system ABC transporter peptidase/ATP-binding protein